MYYWPIGSDNLLKKLNLPQVCPAVEFRCYAVVDRREKIHGYLVELRLPMFLEWPVGHCC